MFSYIKTLIALGLALIIVICAGLWFRHLTAVASALRQEKLGLERQVAEARTYPFTIAVMEKRMKDLQEDIARMAERFAEKDNPGPQLVTTVVKAAGAAGMEMTRTTENVPHNKVMPSKLTPLPDVNVVSYEFGLRGAYSNLVLFAQNIAAWKLAHKIESLDIVRAEDDAAEGQVEVALVLSVFSGNKPNAPKNPGSNP